MASPIHLKLNTSVIPQRVADAVAGLKHWKTGQPFNVQNGEALVTVDAKTIDIFCRNGA
jgi:hypothetical protein